MTKIFSILIAGLLLAGCTAKVIPDGWPGCVLLAPIEESERLPQMSRETLKQEKPNKTMKEAQRGKLPRFSTVQEFMDDLRAGD